MLSPSTFTDSAAPPSDEATGTEKTDLKDLSLAQAEAWFVAKGQPAYRGRQIWRWIHARGVSDPTQMTDIAKDARQKLADEITVTDLRMAEVQRAQDGTRKMRLECADGRSIETVLIPGDHGDHLKMTQCISTQVGCAMDCDFCATAKLKFTRHLSAAEIVDQVYKAKALLEKEEPGRRITNIVYMGMGEPLHNYEAVMRSFTILTSELGANFSMRRITLSTVGQVPGILRLGQEPVRPNLAVSLNAPNDEIRDRIMPINKKWPIAELLGALRKFPLENRRRITFEYVMLAGVNDSLEHADQVARLLRGFRCKVNVIPWNPHPLASYERPADQAIERFQERLRERGMAVYLRTPRGDDIDAACGQLANRSREQVETLVSLGQRA